LSSVWFHAVSGSGLAQDPSDGPSASASVALPLVESGIGGSLESVCVNVCFAESVCVSVSVGGRLLRGLPVVVGLLLPRRGEERVFSALQSVSCRPCAPLVAVGLLLSPPGVEKASSSPQSVPCHPCVPLYGQDVGQLGLWVERAAVPVSA